GRSARAPSEPPERAARAPVRVDRYTRAPHPGGEDDSTRRPPPAYPPTTRGTDPVLSQYRDRMLWAISGGAGFLGLHLARRLLADGHAVRSLDVAPLDEPELERAVEEVRGDIRDPAAARRLAQGADVLVHGATAPTAISCSRSRISSTCSSSQPKPRASPVRHSTSARASSARSASTSSR